MSHVSLSCLVRTLISSVILPLIFFSSLFFSFQMFDHVSFDLNFFHQVFSVIHFWVQIGDLGKGDSSGVEETIFFEGNQGISCFISGKSSLTFYLSFQLRSTGSLSFRSSCTVFSGGCPV